MAIEFMWQNEMVRMVRHLIGDLISPYTYQDDRLEEAILVSSQLVLGEVGFNVTYTIDVDQCTFTPDPTENTRDNDFILLITLKTACLIAQSEYKTNIRSGGGIIVQDGPTKIDTKGSVDSYKDTAKTICQLYEDAKTSYLSMGEVGRGVLTPFASDNINIGGLYNSNRDQWFQ